MSKIKEVYEKYLHMDAILSTLWPSPDFREVIMKDLWQAIKAEVERQENIISLLDGCYPLVEQWKPDSRLKEDWKQDWLKEAKEVTHAEG